MAYTFTPVKTSKDGIPREHLPFSEESSNIDSVTRTNQIDRAVTTGRQRHNGVALGHHHVLNFVHQLLIQHWFAFEKRNLRESAFEEGEITGCPSRQERDPWATDSSRSLSGVISSSALMACVVTRISTISTDGVPWAFCIH